MKAIASMIAAACLAGAGAAPAQPYDTPPPPAPPRPLTIAAPTEQALPNGLRVITARREGMPLVTAVLVVL
jgi:zinc protease